MKRNLNIKQRKWRSFIFATIFGVTVATAVITVKPLESYAYTETAGVLNDATVGTSTIDLHQVLINDTSCTDVQVTYFRVTLQQTLM